MAFCIWSFAAGLVILSLINFQTASGGRKLERVCPRYCPEIYSPQCSNEGKTYDNMCKLRKDACGDPSIRLAHRGKCGKNCNRPCTKIYRPVCGSDGKTYVNDCTFRVAQCKNPRLRMSYRGRCKKSCASICPAVYSPVCGTNGKTYSNRCQLNVDACRNPKQNIRLRYKGPCATKTTYKPGKCPRVLPCLGCLGRRKYDMCEVDADCPSSMKCCKKSLGHRCTHPCPMRKCRPCPAGYKHGVGSNGCPGCNCVCATSLFRCFIDPCRFAYCARYPYARCKPNYCGGCKGDFYLGSRKVDCGLQKKGK